jgi:hypothetical protein
LWKYCLYIIEPLNPQRWFLFENSLEHIWNAEFDHEKSQKVIQTWLLLPWANSLYEAVSALDMQLFPCGNISCWKYFASKESAAQN